MNLPDTDLLANLTELSEEEKRQATLEELSDVDAGRTMTHEEMMAWAQSLFWSTERRKVNSPLLV